MVHDYWQHITYTEINTLNMKLATITVAFITTLAQVSQVMAAEVAGAFGKGKTQIAITGGSGYAFDESYLVLGLGVNYYLMDGLNVGLFLESWSGASPSMYNVTPSVQYVFYQVPVVKPYVGGFVRRSYIDGLPDIDSAGARAGVYIASGRNAFIGIGAVYESYIDCNKAIYVSCDDTYPELSLTFTF
jgi:hypothetical protein